MRLKWLLDLLKHPNKDLRKLAKLIIKTGRWPDNSEVFRREFHRRILKSIEKKGKFR